MKITVSLLMTFLVALSAKGQSEIIYDSLLSHVEVLSADVFKGRKTETAENQKAAQYIVQRFEAFRLDTFGAGYTHPFKFFSRILSKAYDGNNVIGWIPGTKYPGKYIVLSAHYDHVGVRSKKIYNGADDNASGTGALIELARYFSANPPNYSIIFAAFDAEEMGLRGADAFVEEPPVQLDSILLNVNMDMISRNDKRELFICGTSYNAFLRTMLEPIVTETKDIKVIFGHDYPAYQGADDWTRSSDHGKFHQKSIPFLYFGVEDHEDYHQPTDDYENIMPRFYHQVTAFILECLLIIDEQL